jgi:hypothetical protein
VAFPESKPDRNIIVVIAIVVIAVIRFHKPKSVRGEGPSDRRYIGKTST